MEVSLGNQHVVGGDVPEENKGEFTPIDAEKDFDVESSDSSFDDITKGCKEEAAAILSEVLGDIHRHADLPKDIGHVSTPVATSVATSNSAHSSNDIPIRDHFPRFLENGRES